MKNYLVALMVGICILVGGLVAYPEFASAQMKAREEGYCKLTDLNADAELYNGRCTAKVSVDKDGMTVYEIKMRKFNDPFLFAGYAGKPDTWMHGPQKVKIRDRGDYAIFRWAHFRLEVHED